VKKLVLVLCASATLLPGCVKRTVIPDPTVPHQVAREAEIEIWVDVKGDKKVRQKVRLLEGWWIAGPPVVEPEEETK
jgi:hypothetical protein